MRRNIKRKFIATLCAMTMIVGSMSISTYGEATELDITKQPTDANPTVTVNKTDDVTYQWYKAVDGDTYTTADIAGTIVDDEIIAATNGDYYVGDGVWADEMWDVSLYVALLSGDTLRVTPTEGYEVTAAMPGHAITLTDDGNGVLTYTASWDMESAQLCISSNVVGASAKVEIVRDGVTYPVVDGTKDVIDGQICAVRGNGHYEGEGVWSSTSDNELYITVYLKENQSLNITMSNVEVSYGYVASDIEYNEFEIPSNGVYTYAASEAGYYQLGINSGVSFDAKIEVTDIARGQAVTGQTTNTLTAFEEGENYSCLVTCGEEEIWSDYIVGELMIKTQPTAANPTVELNYGVEATYQWYGVEKQMFTVVDNDEPADGEMDIDYIYDGSYSDGMWYGEDYGDYWCLDAQVVVNKSDKVIITLPDGFDGRVYDYGTNEQFYYNNGVYEYIVDNEEGYMNFVIESEAEISATVQVEKNNIGAAIEGEDEATLKNMEFGETYICKIVTADEEFISDFVYLEFAISTQPTATSPVVEVNFPDMVSGYKWYEAEFKQYEIVDESAVTSGNAAEVIGAEAEDGIYEDGVWNSEAYDMGGTEAYDIVVYFEMEEGCVLKIVPSTDEIIMAVLQMGNINAVLQYEDGVYYFESNQSGEATVGLLAAEEFTAEITVEKWRVNDAVEGQETKKLSNHEAGDYICELTLTDGTVVLSEVVSITEADITHTYTDDYDADCNECGATREVPERETETTGTEGAGTVSPNTADGVDMMLILLLACAGIIGTLVTSVLNKRRYQ